MAAALCGSEWRSVVCAGGGAAGWVPRAADWFIALLTTIEERYAVLPRPGHRLQFLELQLELIDEWRVRLTQLLRAATEVLDETFLTSPDSMDPMIAVINAAHHTRTVLLQRAHSLTILNYLSKKDAILRPSPKETKSNDTDLNLYIKKIRKKIIQNKKRKKLEAIEQELETRCSTKRSNKLHNKHKEWVKTLSKSHHGKAQDLTNRNEIVEVATSFYRKLYSETENNEPVKNIIDPNIEQEKLPKILETEVEYAIRQLKKEKSPGEDSITNDTILAMIEPLTPHLTKLYNDIITQNKTPEEWKISLITLLYKKGDPKLIDNYRPISLLPTLYKLFSMVILNRISKSLDYQQPREQAGFRKGYSTTDHIFTLTQIIERYNEYNKKLYVAFIDYSKAFDSISHAKLWESLAEQGIHSKYIHLLKSLYSQASAKIKLERIGDSFDIQRGVKQGDPLSPKLFTALLESVFRKINWHQYGISIDGEILTHLRFADDVVILSEDHENIVEMLTAMEIESQKVGLYMNKSKTKIMTNGEEKNTTIGSGNIEYVKEYIYLGQLISFDNAISKEIDRRITLGWKKYWLHKDIFKSNLPVHLKQKLMESAVLPTVTYGCQTWPLTKNIIRKLNTFQRSAERSMLGIKLRDKVRCSVIRSITKVRDIVEMVCALKWKWAGHVARYTDNRWSERVLNWYPRDNPRSRGRQKRRWVDDIVRVAGNTWQRQARQRGQWKDMEEAFTQQWHYLQLHYYRRQFQQLTRRQHCDENDLSYGDDDEDLPMLDDDQPFEEVLGMSYGEKITLGVVHALIK
ncbi:unnamed protein product [Plutella xylostella]|uniref:(diamondback moth) hypothetical protein n=1 Tax=Plutella xylostella TaxID=51655 RepID=A0A8S4DE08_PLUXY|nr:unnamed protein product [Plutella xylostella]